MKSVFFFFLIVSSSLSLSETRYLNADDLFEEVKENFLASPFCDPSQIINNPEEKANGIILSQALKSLAFLGSTERHATNQFKVKEFSTFASKYELGEELISKVIQKINSLMPYSITNDEPRRAIVAQMKGIVLQEIAKLSIGDVTYQRDIVIKGLLNSDIFVENEEGQPVCPFIDRDAFSKAVEGQQRIAKKFPKSVKSPLISIIDFTRPSNQRRLFVIDLNKRIVLNNTWVAHGMGGKGAAGGSDGYGSNPATSNVNGSRMSSEGFMLATQASFGNLYGRNVLLKGIDFKNTNVASRSIVIHGWESPFGQYTAGVSVHDPQTNKIIGDVDAYKELVSMDFENSTRREMEKTLDQLSKSLSYSKFLASTEGCPGVPNAKLGHLDPLGRKNKNTLELLREDLPGSVIFSYTGPDMISDFF